MSPEKFRKPALVLGTLLIAWAAVLTVSFLVMGFGGRGRIDPLGWGLLAALAVIVGLGGSAIWRCFRPASDSRTGGAAALIAGGVALMVSIAGFASSRDSLTIGLPMLLLSICLAVIQRTGSNGTKPES